MNVTAQLEMTECKRTFLAQRSLPWEFDGDPLRGAGQGYGGGTRRRTLLGGSMVFSSPAVQASLSAHVHLALLPFALRLPPGGADRCPQQLVWEHRAVYAAPGANLGQTSSVSFS